MADIPRHQMQPDNASFPSGFSADTENGIDPGQVTIIPPRPFLTGNPGLLVQQPAAAPGVMMTEPFFLSKNQRDAANVIRRALAERHVFAALTGAPGSGKTMLVATALAAPLGQVRTIRVEKPDQLSDEQAAQLERIALDPAAGGPHTVLVIDDAHVAPPGLLRCLTRLAEIGRLKPGSAQVLLVGRPELWNRLEVWEFAPLVERIAVRPVLQPMTDDDARGLISHLLDQPRKIFGQTLTADAEREVLRLADGKPGRIGAIVRSTLTLGDVPARPPISIGMIRSATAMLDGQQQGQPGKRRNRLFLPALAPIAAAALVIGVVLAGPDRLLDRASSIASDLTRKITSSRAPTPVETPAPAPPQVIPAAPAQSTSTPQQTAPAVAPPLAVQGDADRLTAQSRPPPPMPAPAETPEQPVTASPAPPPSPVDQPREPNSAQDRVETSAPTAAAVTPPSPTPPTPSAAAPIAVPGPAPGNALSPPTPAAVAALLRRGDEVLAMGDIATARRFYERTIPAGSALGARGIARTYDPALIGRTNPAADPEAAAAWYKTAAELDSAEATARQQKK